MKFLSSRKMFWGEVRLQSVVMLGIIMLSLTEGASIASQEEEIISLEGLRHLAQQQHQQQQDLNNVKIIMTSGGGNDEDVELEDDTGVGDDDRVENVRVHDELDDEEADIVQAAASDVVEMLEEREVPPVKTLEAAEMLLEKYKERLEEEDGLKEEEQVQQQQEEEEEEKEENRKLFHHRRHPTPLSPPQQDEENQPIEHVVQHHQEPQSIPTAVLLQMARAQSGRSLWSAEHLEGRTSELCGTSASIECGKRILSLIEGQEMSEMSLHTKCDLRDDFLKCIDTQKRDCLELATAQSVLPQLPPKDSIKTERAKLWKVLWTAGGCVLAN